MSGHAAVVKRAFAGAMQAANPLAHAPWWPAHLPQRMRSRRRSRSGASPTLRECKLVTQLLEAQYYPGQGGIRHALLSAYPSPQDLLHRRVPLVPCQVQCRLALAVPRPRLRARAQQQQAGVGVAAQGGQVQRGGQRLQGKGAGQGDVGWGGFTRAVRYDVLS